MISPSTKFAIMRVEKRKDLTAIRRCAAHHLRTVETPNADPERGIKILAGPATHVEVVEAFKDAVEPLKKRRDATLALDLFIGASPSYFASGGSTEDFEERALGWAKEVFGIDNVVLAVAHHDESTPHVQLLIAPITPKGSLSASNWIDGPKKLSALQDSLADAMKPLGLSRGIRGSKARHQRIKRWYGELVPRMRDAQAQIEEAEQSLRRVKAERREVEAARKKIDEKRAFLAEIYNAMSEAQRRHVQQLVDASEVIASRQQKPRS